MSLSSKIFAVSAVAAALASPAAAQGVVTQKNVSLGLAMAVAQGALDKCMSMGFKVSVSVLDRDGLQVVMLRGDGAGLHTPEGSDRKAYTARAYSAPSANFAKRATTEANYAPAIQYNRMLALSGGLPIKAGSEIIGAVGVSGSPGKDEECSQAGIDKVADQLK